VADVLELLALGVARGQGDGGVCGGPGAHRGLLVHAEHQRPFGRAQVEPAHVGGPGPELRVVFAGEPALHPVRLEVEVGQHPPDLRGAHPGPFRQRRPGPVRARRRWDGGDRSHHPEPFVVTVGSRPTRAFRVGQAVDPLLAETFPPAGYDADGHVQALGEGDVLGALRCQQDDLGSQHHRVRRGIGPGPGLKLGPVQLGQLDHERGRTRHHWPPATEPTGGSALPHAETQLILQACNCGDQH